MLIDVFVFKTKILRMYPIPEYKTTKWVPEGIIWERIDKNYKSVFFNEFLSIADEPNKKSLSGQYTSKFFYNNGSVASFYYYDLFYINEGNIFNIRRKIISYIKLWFRSFYLKDKNNFNVIKQLKGFRKFIAIFFYSIINHLSLL